MRELYQCDQDAEDEHLYHCPRVGGLQRPKHPASKPGGRLPKLSGSTSQITPAISRNGITVVVAKTKMETAGMSACQSLIAAPMIVVSPVPLNIQTDDREGISKGK